ncbi:MAG: hypothetical protein AAF378_07065 [Cyanobacteria bacterium P01_A01_bin.84]
MKRQKIKFSETISYTFARLSTYTGYAICVLAVFIFVVHQDPKGIDLVPVANLFFEAAKISVGLEKDTKNIEKNADKPLHRN